MILPAGNPSTFRRSTSGRRAAAGAVILLLAGTPFTARPASADLVPADVRARLAASGLDPQAIEAPMKLGSGMAEWANERVQRGGPDNVRLKRLLRELYENDEIAFEYQEGYTGTVGETFRTGRYNCLSFSMLFVALARELDLPAFFLSISRDQTFRRDGDLVVLTRHITAGYGSFADRTVLEFDVGPQIDYAAAAPIDDVEALALFYSNRGAELLREDRLAQAEEMLDIAVLLAPDIAQSWVNLGVAQRRQERFAEAKQSYEQAIKLERDNIAAFQNLLILLRRQGDHDSADELISLLDRRGNRNPFTFLALGDFSLEDGRLSEAGRFYRKAHRLARDEAETHAALGLWSFLVGKTDRARSWLRSAREIDADNERVDRLERRLAAHGSSR